MTDAELHNAISCVGRYLTLEEAIEVTRFVPTEEAISDMPVLMNRPVPMTGLLALARRDALKEIAAKLERERAADQAAIRALLLSVTNKFRNHTECVVCQWITPDGRDALHNLGCPVNDHADAIQRATSRTAHKGEING